MKKKLVKLGILGTLVCSCALAAGSLPSVSADNVKTNLSSEKAAIGPNRFFSYQSTYFGIKGQKPSNNVKDYLVYPATPTINDIPKDLTVNTDHVDYNKLGSYAANFLSESTPNIGGINGAFDYLVGEFTAKPITILKGEKAPRDATKYHVDYNYGVGHLLQDGIGVDVDTSQVDTNKPGEYPVTLSYHPSADYSTDTITTKTAVTVSDPIAPSQLSAENVRYVNTDNQEIAPEQVFKGLNGSPYKIAPKEIKGYTFVPELSSKTTGVYNNSTLTYVYRKDNPVAPTELSGLTVIHSDTNGEQIAPDKIYKGLKGEKYSLVPEKIPGYQFVPKLSDKTKGFFGHTSHLIFVYQHDEMADGMIKYKDQNGKTVPGSDQAINQDITTDGNKISLRIPAGYRLGNNGSVVENGQVTVKAGDNNITISVIANGSGTPDSGSQGNAVGPDGVRRNTKVYAVHAFNMYKHDNLTGKIRHYKKVKRVNRPRFLVKRIVWNHGHARYYVKQLNKKRYGWITGNAKFVQNNYYQPRKRAIKFKVIRPRGLREYRRRNLTGSRRGIRYGKVMTAKRVVKDGLQTRFQLKNGRYVSARKNFVIYK